MTTTPNDEVYCLVLLVDSDVAYCQQVRQAFEQHNRQFAQRESAAGATARVNCRPVARKVQLVAVNSLREARRTLATRTPDLVIANVQLTDGQGTEVLAAGGNLPYPVLITSDKGGEQLAVEVMKAGAMDYVVKSVTTPALMPEIVAAAFYDWTMMLDHRRLQLEIVELPQREQQRLGRELHDGLGQQLTGLGLMARSLAKRLAGAARREQEMAEQLASGLEQALAQVRSLSRGLIPVETDALGLVSALEELAARISEQSGIRIELQHEHPILISDNETATHVYRIVQEAINNAVKHARADTITLILETDDREAIIEVRDNGRGLPEDVHQQTGLGLRTMFHRCQLFGGSLDIYTHDEGGTRVRCCFPLNPEKRAS
jgi:signal transduction histidine kinase